MSVQVAYAILGRLADFWYRLLKVADRVFAKFVDVVDHFEGAQIRHISDCANPIVNMLLDASDDVHVPVFELESLDGQSIISQSSRCSSALADLLLPHEA